MKTPLFHIFLSITYKVVCKNANSVIVLVTICDYNLCILHVRRLLNPPQRIPNIEVKQNDERLKENRKTE